MCFFWGEGGGGFCFEVFRPKNGSFSSFMKSQCMGLNFSIKLLFLKNFFE